MPHLERSTPDTLSLQQQPLRVFHQFFHPHQERHRLAPVDNAMIVGQGDVHHWANDNLPVERHRTFLNLVHAQDAYLRRVEDRR